jgi:hypothetical protein
VAVFLAPTVASGARQPLDDREERLRLERVSTKPGLCRVWGYAVLGGRRAVKWFLTEGLRQLTLYQDSA